MIALHSLDDMAPPDSLPLSKQKPSQKAENPSSLTGQRVSSGADSQIRTGDLILTKDALYRLSYISKPISQTAEAVLRNGRGRRIRTLGTRFWRPLLYQLSYTPVWWAFGDSNPGPDGYEPSALTN